MQTLSWIGGGNNRADNRNDWSPASAPQSGDSLEVGGAAGSPALGLYTMNVEGTDLAGDTLQTGSHGTLTANLSHHAVATPAVSFGDATFNLKQASSLSLSISHATATVSVAGKSSLDLDPAYGQINVSVSGTDRISMSPNEGGPAGVTFTLASGARLVGTLDTPESGVTIHGPAGSTFDNDGASTINAVGSVIGVDVTGAGSFTVPVQNFDFSGFNLEFLAAVGANQSVSDGGEILIAKATEFRAAMTLTSAHSIVDLQGIASADSYSFANDLLSIYSGNSVIDRMRLTDQTPYGFDVTKTAAGDVNIVALNTPGQTVSGALPIHA
jgi:hypothetical protein